MDFSKVKLNPSMLGAVMSEPKGALTDKMFDKLEYLKYKPERTPAQELERIELQFRMDNYDPTALSKGCMMYLVFLYQHLKYGAQFNIKGKKKGSSFTPFIKGSKTEKSAFELIKRVTGHNLYRPKARISNDYLRGQIDVADAKDIKDASKIIDIKNPFSQFNFMKIVGTKEIPRSDNFQVQGYLSIAEKDYGEVYYCLSDFTDDVIEEQRIQMMKIICPDGIITEQFEEQWAMAENSMRFGHIPDEERVIVFKVERDSKIIGKINEKVEFCREWMAEFESKHMNRIADQLYEWEKQRE